MRTISSIFWLKVSLVVNILLLFHIFGPSFPNVGNTKSDFLEMEQEDDRLVNYIRKFLLIPPPESDTHYSDPLFELEANGNAEHIMAIFQNMTNGFFIESGANDGIFLSNTLPLELLLNWTGILIEPDPIEFIKLQSIKRRSWLMANCLSKETKPMKNVTMWRYTGYQGISYIGPQPRNMTEWAEFSTECFPLYSILKAVGRTEIDYFALDVEKSELAVLQTFPWDKVLIKTLTVEVHPEFVDPIKAFMITKGYKYIKTIIVGCCTHDQLYIHEKALEMMNLEYAVPGFI